MVRAEQRAAELLQVTASGAPRSPGLPPQVQPTDPRCHSWPAGLAAKVALGPCLSPGQVDSLQKSEPPDLTRRSCPRHHPSLVPRLPPSPGLSCQQLFGEHLLCHCISATTWVQSLILQVSHCYEAGEAQTQPGHCPSGTYSESSNSSLFVPSL